MLTPFWNSSRFPRDSMMSISPDAGQVLYALKRGIIQMAGLRRKCIMKCRISESKKNSDRSNYHNQSPAGSFARTSTRPYLKKKDSTVRILALIVGLMILFPAPVRSQPQKLGLVHASAGAPPCRLSSPLKIKSSPYLSAVSVGFRYRIPSRT